MIFATVGTQLPFPRLIDCLDRLAPELGEPVIAQTAVEGAGWPNLESRATVRPADFTRTIEAARVVVAHAGIGTILTARKHRKPLVIMPRRHDLGEHRNDHQTATARQVETMPGIHVAWDETALERFLKAPDLAAASDDGPRDALNALVARLRGFIDGA